MSGDIGKGTVHASIDLAEKILGASMTSKETSVHDDNNIDNYHQNNSSSSHDRHHYGNIESIDFNSFRHFIQLAGGTNIYSPTAAHARGLLAYRGKGFGGYAFGGYARKIISGYLNRLEADHPGTRIEDHEEVLRICLDFANDLVRSAKNGGDDSGVTVALSPRSES